MIVRRPSAASDPHMLPSAVKQRAPTHAQAHNKQQSNRHNTRDALNTCILMSFPARRSVHSAASLSSPSKCIMPR